ncbi:Vacuolar amino acid transporter 2 [Beauveria bassiana D1-5]|uniref:Vacuolar amino acid transporter 2 n=1 Tax=Beauveria bassiana D1-5 TaxID=1245745 RepID=A0A0A2VXZ0_BEABA|nr:Vacuolar amino acid transporter 2 [Beauveria bassiana D1-5]
MMQDKHGGDPGAGGDDWNGGEDRQGLLAGGDYGHDDDNDKEVASLPNGSGGRALQRYPRGGALDNVDHAARRVLDLEDPLRDDHDDHRMPLLTSLEAPSVALANDLDDDNDDAGDVVARQLRRPKSGLQSAFMNMANSIIGAGIIGQPKLSGTSSFQGTVEHCFGRAGLIAISLAQWVFAFGGMVAFGVIVGDTIPHVLLAVWPGLPDVPVIGLLTDRRVAIAVFVMGISYPLTLYRDISKLAKASTFALVGMLVIVVTVLTQGLLVPSEAKGEFSLPLLTLNTGIFQAIGVISFAFVCHHNSLLIYGSLRTPTIDNFSRVTHYSTGVSMLACLVMALGGFLVFGDKTLGNVLNNFPSDNIMVNVARLCFGLNMLTTLPLEAFVCREVMLTYWWPDEPFNLRRHLVLSTGLVASATFLSLVTCDLGAVFELVGATSAVAMAYILPPMCYMKLTTRSWRTYLAGTIVVFGGLVMAISVIQAVEKLINSKPDTL